MAKAPTVLYPVGRSHVLAREIPDLLKVPVKTIVDNAPPPVS